MVIVNKKVSDLVPYERTSKRLLQSIKERSSYMSVVIKWRDHE